MIQNRHLTSREDDIPKWKQDLLQKRKSTSKTIVSAGGMVKLTVACPANMVKTITANQISKNSPRNRPHSIHIETTNRRNSGEGQNEFSNNSYSKVNSKRESVILDNNIKETFLNNTVKNETMNKPKVNIKLKINDMDYNSDSSDDENYRASVHAIKDKYITKCSSPPPVSNLEKRAISLEDIQQIDSTRLKPKYDFMKRPCQFKVSQYQAKYLEMINESKKTSYKYSNSTAEYGNGCEENPTNISDTITKDLVKQRAKMFEPNPGVKLGRPLWGRPNKNGPTQKARPISFHGSSKESFLSNERNSRIDSETESNQNTTKADDVLEAEISELAKKFENTPNTHGREGDLKDVCIIATKYIPPNHMFPDISSVENPQITNQETVVCI